MLAGAGRALGLLLALLCGCAAAPDVQGGFAGVGPLLGPPSYAYSPSRDEAWVNLTVSGYREPLWRMEPLVRAAASVLGARRPSPHSRPLPPPALAGAGAHDAHILRACCVCTRRALRSRSRARLRRCTTC